MAIVLLLKKIIRELLRYLSEVEANFSQPNYPLYIRKFYLQAQKIKYGHILWIGKGLHLLNPGNLTLGERCAIGEFARIENHASIVIGDDFISASGLNLNSGTHDPSTLVPRLLPINIGHRVWCGVNVTIIAGVNIGDDVILGAGSVVCKDIPSNSIAVGVPAKVIKQLNRENINSLWTWAKNNNC
jgi:maltose O-acetyltransferase